MTAYANDPRQVKGSADRRIVELSREHPFWDYEKLARSLAKEGIHVSAFYVVTVLSEATG